MNILDTIVEQKRRELALLGPRIVTDEALREAMRHRGAQRDFMAALKNPGRPGPALIAEVKKASPSAGVICADFDPVRIAREYEAAGATCLSVLTDEKFFQGSLQYLKEIRSAVSLPLLRKDFVIHEKQILEAIEWGADAVLLIVAILSDGQLSDYLAFAAAAGLTALVEVHNEDEMKRALDAGATLIGVNNRNLKTFKVDLGTVGRLATMLPPGRAMMLVAESGIHTAEDVEQVRRAGAEAILVGESLMRAGKIAEQIDRLLPRPFQPS